MPQSFECKLCPNYPCLAVILHEEENMVMSCPYEVVNGLHVYEVCKDRFTKAVNGKVEKPTQPSILVERLK